MTTPAQNSVNSGTKSNEQDKVENTMHGTGKDFDALVSTLKMAIERGDIDKENVHRMAHGLGIKPETLAQMVGAPSKDSIQAKDQDDSPESEVAPPDVQKNFKDFRDETAKAISVVEELELSEGVKSRMKQQTSKDLQSELQQIRRNCQRTKTPTNECNAKIRQFRLAHQRKGGSNPNNPVNLAKGAQDENVELMSNARVQAAIRSAKANIKS
jgi:hypothetical protein